MRVLSFCAATLALAVPAASGHAAVATAVVADPAEQTLALQLAEAAQPGELLVEAILVGYDQGAKQGAADPANAEIEKEFPGYLDKIEKRGRKLLETMMRERTPALHREIAGIYSQGLSEEQMQSALAFLQTPTGKKMIRNVAMAPARGEAAEDLHFSAEEVTAEGRAAALHSFKALSGQERVEVMKFSLSPTGRALTKTSKEVNAVFAQAMNAIMTDFTAKMEALTMDVLADYTG